MNTRKYSYEQEQRIAKLLNGKVNANSGATDFYKGDVRTMAFLVECKTSTSPCKSVSIKKEWLEKLKEEQFSMGKLECAIGFDFGDGKDYFIIESKMMKFLVENYERDV